MVQELDMIEKAKLILELSTNSPLQLDLFTKYSVIADVCTGADNESNLINNKDTFAPLISSTMVDISMGLTATAAFREAASKNLKLSKMFSSKEELGKYIKRAQSIMGVQAVTPSNSVELESALRNYNIPLAKEISEEELLESSDIDAILDSIPFEDDIVSNILNGNTDEEEEIEIEGDPDIDSDLDPDSEEEFSEADLEEETDSGADTGSGKEADSGKDEKQTEAEENEVDSMILDSTVGSIMNIYDKLYQPLFEQRPKGVLTPNGIVSINIDNDFLPINNGKVFAIAAYDSIVSSSKSALKSMDYHEELTEKCLNADGTLRYNYCPNLQIKNVYGLCETKDNKRIRISNWSKFRIKLRESVILHIKRILSRFKGDAIVACRSLVEIFTTCVVAESFDLAKDLLLTIHSDSIERAVGYKVIGNNFIRNNPFGRSEATMELINNETQEMGIHKILLVFDKKKYNGEILFAYKAVNSVLEGGGVIGAESTIIGRDVKGGYVKYNFKSEQAIVSTIIAGSGSGKGVVTLNLLATFIASGFPIAYIDWKPDMAAMLWDLERKTGARILSIDGLAGVSKKGVKPVRNYGTGYNGPTIEDVSDKLNVIPYIKSMQLMIGLALARQTSYGGMSSRGNKMMFILDEAQAMNKVLGPLGNSLDAYIKENKPKKGETPTEEYKYCSRLQKMLNSLFSGLVEFRNTTGRVGNIGCLLLGQQPDATAWSVGAMKRDPLGYLVGNSSMKMLGKGAIDSTKYSLGDAIVTGKELLGSMGYFAVVPDALASKSLSDKIQVAKTYMVLNENDYNPDNPDQSGPDTLGLLNNLTDPTIKQMAIDDFYSPETGLNSLVGFPGLIEYMGQNIEGFDLNTNLSAGYDLAEQFLTSLGILGTGKYRDIEGYLFDCSIDGLYTCGEIQNAIRNNKTVQEVISGESSTNEDTDDSDTDSADTFKVYADDESDDEPLDFGTPTPTPLTSQSKSNGTGNTPIPSTAAKRVRLTEDEEKIFFGSQNTPVNEASRVEQATRASGVGRTSGMTGTNTVEEPVIVENSTNANDNIFESDEDIGLEVDETDYDMSGEPTPLDSSFDYETNTQNNAAESPVDKFKEYKRILESLSEEDRDTLSRFGILPDAEPATMTGGGSGKFINIIPSKINKPMSLNAENSIDVKISPSFFIEKKRDRFYKTLWGTKYDLKKRWKVMLDIIGTQINPNIVRRIVINGNNILFNNRIVHSTNIIGGVDDIRLTDIIDFKLLFKRFPNINELAIDEDTLCVLQLEFPNIPEGLFNITKELNIISVVSPNREKLVYTRGAVMSEKERRKLEEADLRNRMDTVCAAKNTKSFSQRTPGENMRFYTGAKSLKDRGLGNAYKHLMAEKPHIFKAAFWGLFGVASITVGGIGYGIGKLTSRFR